MKRILLATLLIPVLATAAGVPLPRPRPSNSAKPVSDAQPAPKTGKAEEFANLEGLPGVTFSKETMSGTALEVKNAPGKDEPGCKDLPASLRALAFFHFNDIQALENAQGRYFPAAAADKAAHLLGMVPKESSGEATAVTDMRGKNFATYRPETNLSRWQGVFGQAKLIYNKQTNFGLAQQSMDRLMAPFRMNTNLDEFLKTDPKATAGENVRKVIAVYQQFAQGRVKNSDRPIPEAQLKDPNAPQELKDRARLGVQKALWHCGSRFMYKEGYQGEKGQKSLEDAMASIAYCNAGTKNPDPSNKAQSACFAKWVTLCPTLNLDIALYSPDAYFATRNARSLCKKTFQKAIVKDPNAKK